MPGDLVTNLIVLHPCTKFEVRTPSHSGDIADFFGHGVNRPGDLDL